MTPLSSVDHMVSFTRNLLDEAHSRSLCLSSFGSIAVRIQTESCSLLLKSNRSYKDIDLVSLSPYQEPLHRWLGELGWQRWEEVFLVSEGKRAVYKSNDHPFVIEIFFDELPFCHRIDLKDRIGEQHTLPLADLLLTKLQRAEPRARDFEDIAALLACKAAEFSSPDKPAMKRVVDVLSFDWEFCHTSLKNLSQLSRLVSQSTLASTLTPQGLRELAVVTQSVMAAINQAPKSVFWRLRSSLGERYRWYRSVEPLTETF
jgi:hypothetical protein